MKIDWTKVKEGLTTMDILKEENKELKEQLQQKENTIKEIGEMLYKRDKDDYDIYTANVLCDIQSDFEEILRGEY